MISSNDNVPFLSSNLILKHPPCPLVNLSLNCWKLSWIDFIDIFLNFPPKGPIYAVSSLLNVPSLTIPDTTRPIPFNLNLSSIIKLDLSLLLFPNSTLGLSDLINFRRLFTFSPVTLDILKTGI